MSLNGITDAGSLNTEDVAERVAVIRRHMGSIPVGVGFGIRDAESAQRVARVADAVVIGSKLIETMEQAVADAPAAQQTNAAVTAASGWLRTIRQALDQVKRDGASA
ncbi:tryptophan synthase subunit alpha [compost metagenome]